MFDLRVHKVRNFCTAASNSSLMHRAAYGAIIQSRLKHTANRVMSKLRQKRS